MPTRMFASEGRIFLGVFVACIAFFVFVSVYFFPHVIAGDALSYEAAVNAYMGGEQPQIPVLTKELTLDIITVHRMLTTALGIWAVGLFSTIFGSLIAGWLVWESILFFAICILFYALLLRVFQSPRVALVGGLFFAGNYSMLAHGLGLFMDIGGWLFFTLSIFYLYAYIESGKYRDLLISALAIMLGAFFKENALFASIPLTVVLLFENYRSPMRFLRKIIPLGLLIGVPVAIHHVQIYLQYGYTYIYWTQLVPPHYSSRVLEYVKSLGSLFTVLAPLSAFGAYIFASGPETAGLDTKKRLFIAAVILGGLPVLMWPGITQRVLFMLVPGAVLLACVLFRRYEKYWYVFVPVAALYVVMSIFMDSYILDLVNLPF